MQFDIETQMPQPLDFTVHVTGSCGTFHGRSWVTSGVSRGSVTRGGR